MAQYREEQQQHHVTRNFYHQQRLRTATATMNGNYSALFFKSKSNQHTLNYINLNYWRQYCNYLPLIFRELLFNNYLLSRNNQRATTITTTVGEFSSSEQPWINFNFFLSPVATMQARQHRRNGLEILPLLDIYGTKPQQQHDLSPSTLSTSSSGVLSVDDHTIKVQLTKYHYLLSLLNMGIVAIIWIILKMMVITTKIMIIIVIQEASLKDVYQQQR